MTNPQISPLAVADVQDLLDEHVEFLASVLQRFPTAHSDADGFSAMVAREVVNRPEIIASIAKRAFGASVSDAGPVAAGMQMVQVARVVAATVQAYPGGELMELLRQAIAPYAVEPSEGRG